SFENALDLLTVCSIVLIRKPSGNLDLLTEAQVVRRFNRLRSDLAALYAAYYVAELLADWTQENDPHPALFDEVIATLAELGGEQASTSANLAARVLRFELIFLHEMGYRPVLERCSGCEGSLGALTQLGFSPVAAGVLCPRCRAGTPHCKPLSAEGWRVLLDL